ncbi:hypothetical protein DPMN_116220 [Dreissena polymorpha]|uniref:Uncharacterized protein n=1 Tax=Dreissena polymorpha TaxID=45954 RepID=A0A9D4QT85_DREPO|nr:hypothetical protein DPMN_116220 [Dreissena polymorpha]
MKSDSESDHDDSADDEIYDPNNDEINSTDSEFDIKRLKTKKRRVHCKSKEKLNGKRKPRN